MAYANIQTRLDSGGVVILDGGVGTELERRGAPMDAEAWCGPATLNHLGLLEAVHLDYIKAGADIITANTYASSRLMLAHAGYGDRFEEINRAAVAAACRAREASGRADLLVAGSLSHMNPVVKGGATPDLDRTPEQAEMADAFGELARLHQAEGCDLILLEMMYDPDRMKLAFEAAAAAGLPVWAGFSVRRSADGRVLSFLPDREVPFEDILPLLADYDVAAAGIMHSSSDVIEDAITILGKAFDGPLLAYPDSGYFKMPHWQFEGVIAPDVFRNFAERWVAAGVQAIGGCCGLSPAHIAAIADLKDKSVEPDLAIAL